VQPIIIVGTGRCGSTLLHRVLARHDELAWLSTFNEVFPEQTWLAAFSRLYEWPLPNRVKHLRAFPKPYEAYRFWEHYLPGFSRRDRPLTAADPPAEGIPRIREATERIVRAHGRSRLLVKVTGWSRVEYFDRIYPDARFVALSRDPRSVVSSWLQAGWLDVSSAPLSPSWEWGEVPGAYLEAWRDLGGDAILSASVKIRLDLDDIARNVAAFPERSFEFSYEDLLKAPESALRAICGFSGLPWTPRFERAVRETHFYDSRETWRRHLSEDQGERILEFFQRAKATSDTV
jgi:Sulfotransferase family